MVPVIKIADKQFTPYISQQKIRETVESMAGQMNKELRDEFPLFLVVLNGAFMFASDLLKEITIPCQVCFVKVASYAGVASSGSVTELIGLTEDVSGRTVVIVEDIVDTGLTIGGLMAELQTKKIKSIKVATALFKPGSYKLDCPIDYCGISIGNEFVVGYGLDYNGLGRNLKEIYVLA